MPFKAESFPIIGISRDSILLKSVFGKISLRLILGTVKFKRSEELKKS